LIVGSRRRWRKPLDGWVRNHLALGKMLEWVRKHLAWSKRPHWGKKFLAFSKVLVSDRLRYVGGRRCIR
jgi:hypothetical protein